MKYAGAEKRVKKKEGKSEERKGGQLEKEKRMKEREGKRERRGSGDDDDDGDDGSFLPRSELFAVALGTSPRAEGGNKTNGNARR